ncbi:hypothetical protein N7539_005463 [Penicillium diatomitis]|uniref:Uncharacterized protein n=1 Tax=Penicillium diatomitis TaxID=2819901 RepID=A0A9X0BVB3_9EURO|nr:uncharacterized protein N7539_005463 [Penicillium diatomitis]KAJ5485475.1 hypothetical protein N7539_005463 [Penicillium diatomitis]
MATAKGGVNFVRIFFYSGNTISAERKKSLVALAYATARDQLLAPKAILIRSDMHNTTTSKSGHVMDPKGWHGTFAFKASDQLLREYHVASHGYTNGKEDFTLKEATHTSEKADNTRRGGPLSDKVVWPPEEFLEEYKESPIAYSHLPGQG